MLTPVLRAACGLTVAASIASAQSLNDQGQYSSDGDWRVDARLTAANAAIGAVTAGAYSVLRGRPLLPALRGGALGGAIAYGGKRVSAGRFVGAGLVGRQLGSVGHSVIRNASDGQSLGGRLVLPLGPVRFYIRPDSGTRLRARVDVPAVLYALVVAVDGNSLDLGQSASSGALVFRSGAPLGLSEGVCLAGMTFGSVILLDNGGALGSIARSPSFGHERVHVSQFDQLFLTASDPFEAWLAERVPGGRTLKRYADFNILVPAVLLPSLLTSWERRPWEREAISVTHRSFGDRRSFDGGTYNWICNA